MVTFSYLNYNWFVFTTKGNYLSEWARCVAVYSGGIAISVLLLPVLVCFRGDKNFRFRPR